MTDGYWITITTPFVIDEWAGTLTIRLPGHVSCSMQDDEVESALFSEYVRANGDEAFAP